MRSNTRAATKLNTFAENGRGMNICSPNHSEAAAGGRSFNKPGDQGERVSGIGDGKQAWIERVVGRWTVGNQ